MEDACVEDAHFHSCFRRHTVPIATSHNKWKHILLIHSIRDLKERRKGRRLHAHNALSTGCLLPRLLLVVALQVVDTIHHTHFRTQPSSTQQTSLLLFRESISARRLGHETMVFGRMTTLNPLLHAHASSFKSAITSRPPGLR